MIYDSPPIQHNQFQQYSNPNYGYNGPIQQTDSSKKAFIPFFGYVDPILLIAIVAFPILGTLGITSLLMPIIPIVIYIIGLIFPSSRKYLKARNKLNQSTEAITMEENKNDLLSNSSLNSLWFMVEKSIDTWKKRSNIKRQSEKHYSIFKSFKTLKIVQQFVTKLESLFSWTF